ncbi:Uncharacterised protein [Mycobacteroides abscessus subsp. abscessus]|nr:Uncharacterised protein [Mycobacteroides abscessus subsp. abscessus]
MSAIASDCAAGALVGSATCSSLQACTTFSARRTMSRVVAARLCAARSRSAVNSARVHTGTGASRSVAASAQSSSSADSEPSGLDESSSRERGSRPRSTVFMGDGIDSRNRRRAPVAMAARCSDSVANT